MRETLQPPGRHRGAAGARRSCRRPRRSTTGTRWSSASSPARTAAPVLGLHERGTFDRVFELETCLLPSALTVEIVRLTQRVRARARAGAPTTRRGTTAWCASSPCATCRYRAVRRAPGRGQRRAAGARRRGRARSRRSRPRCARSRCGINALARERRVRRGGARARRRRDRSSSGCSGSSSRLGRTRSSRPTAARPRRSTRPRSTRRRLAAARRCSTSTAAPAR